MRVPPWLQANDEKALLSALRTAVLNTIRGVLDPNYPSENIRNDYIICHVTSTSASRSNTPEVHRLTYRGRLFDTANTSISTILSGLQLWVNSEEKMIVQDVTTPTLLIDSDCPVVVRTMSYPLCIKGEGSTDAQGGAMVSVQSGGECVSVPIFAASLAAIFLFLVVVAMVIIVCILLWSQGAKIK